jgi:ribosomal protein S18 acetylase RimI-like enzyme
MTPIRTAQESDLEAIYDVWYQTDVVPENSLPPPRGDVPAYLRHVLRTGTLLVAERQEKVIAYSGAVTRAGISFLTDLFVHPHHQSSNLGATLLQRAFPPDGLIHCTLGSSDPRALALYIRAGMIPQWPCFGLRLEPLASSRKLAPSDVEIGEAQPEDLQTLIRLDAELSGRYRPEDHTFWIQEEQGVPLLFRRAGHVAGYGYVRLGGGTPWHPEACALGPIGAGSVEEAAACVLAAVEWAAERAKVIRIEVPGPHPCLAPLLERGFRLTFVDTFVTSAPEPFCDARRYVPSGGDLF